MIIDSLVEYLEDEGIGIVGTDIFVGELPLNNNNCISLVYVPSPDPDKSIPYYKQSVDIRARFSKYAVGYAKLKEILDLLHRKENYSISGYHVYLSYSNGMIIDNDRDVERRHLFQMNLNFVFREDDLS